MKAPDFSRFYTLEPGDKWCWIGDEIIIANPNKIPFTINLKTGERQDLTIDRDITHSESLTLDRTWVHYGY